MAAELLSKAEQIDHEKVYHYNAQSTENTTTARHTTSTGAFSVGSVIPHHLQGILEISLLHTPTNHLRIQNFSSFHTSETQVASHSIHSPFQNPTSSCVKTAFNLAQSTAHADATGIWAQGGRKLPEFFQNFQEFISESDEQEFTTKVCCG